MVAAVEEAILVATGAEGSVALTDLETAEDSVDPQEEGSVIATAELETVASGEEGPRHQEVNRVVSEEDSEEGEIMMVMAAGPEMNDPAADAMTTAPRLRGTCPPIRAKTHTNTETIHKSNDWLPAPYSFLCRYFTTSSTKKKQKTDDCIRMYYDTTNEYAFPY